MSDHQYYQDVDFNGRGYEGRIYQKWGGANQHLDSNRTKPGRNGINPAFYDAGGPTRRTRDEVSTFDKPGMLVVPRCSTYFVGEAYLIVNLKPVYYIRWARSIDPSGVPKYTVDQGKPVNGFLDKRWKGNLLYRGYKEVDGEAGEPIYVPNPIPAGNR